LDRLNERLAGEYPGALTLFAALERHFPGATFTPGCRTTGDAGLDLAAAATAAAAADAVVLAVGGKGGWGLSSTSGEGVDSTETGLPGRQRELAQAVIAANPRTAIVHLDGRPLIEPGLYEAAAAVLEAWFPGPDGAAAIADVLAGRAEPAGRLPVDVPRSVGQQPVFHGQHFGSRSDQPISNMINPDGYVNEPAQALLPFGAGLSYTAFAWDGFAVTLDESFPEPVITATCRVANTGRREGTEVVQLYGTDLVASLVRPQQVLLGFQRLTLAPGESRRVTFRAPVSLFAFPDDAGAWAVEAGGVTVRLASSARDVRFEAAVRLAGTITVDPARRSFLAASEVAP
jgi:beta-glucosidase